MFTVAQRMVLKLFIAEGRSGGISRGILTLGFRKDCAGAAAAAQD